jgi:Uma2 family endonuclease
MTVDPDFEWPRPPEGGYTSDDLDRLPNLPPHTELIDGSLVVVSAQSNFRTLMLRLLEFELLRQLPDGLDVRREMSVVLGRRNRPEPDLIVIRADAAGGLNKTAYLPDDVVVAVEVVSPDSEARDRETKPRKYAEAGIRHFWRVENDGGRPNVYVYELDPSTGSYIPTGIYHDKLRLQSPFVIDVDLTSLGRRPSLG